MINGTIKRLSERAHYLQSAEGVTVRSMLVFVAMRHITRRTKYHMRKQDKVVSYELHRKICAKERRVKKRTRFNKELSVLRNERRLNQPDVRSYMIERDDPNHQVGIDQLLGDFFTPSDGCEMVGFGMHFDLGDGVIDYDSTKPTSPLNSMDVPITKGPSGLKH